MRSLFLGPMREHVCEPGTVTSNPDDSVYTRWLQVLCCNVGYEPWDTRERAGRGVSCVDTYILLSRSTRAIPPEPLLLKRHKRVIRMPVRNILL